MRKIIKKIKSALEDRLYAITEDAIYVRNGKKWIKYLFDDRYK